MKHREPISEKVVLDSLAPVSKEDARANARLILRPFENAILIPPSSQSLSAEELYSVERNEGFFTNESTLRGAKRRIHLLGAISTRTFVVPESLPSKPEKLREAMYSDAVKKLAMASVSLTSSFPIRFKAEHSLTMHVPVDPNASAQESAAAGITAFLNGDGLMEEGELEDFSCLLAATREMIEQDGLIMQKRLQAISGRDRKPGVKGLLRRRT